MSRHFNNVFHTVADHTQAREAHKNTQAAWIFDGIETITPINKEFQTHDWGGDKALSTSFNIYVRIIGWNEGWKIDFYRWHNWWLSFAIRTPTREHERAYGHQFQFFFPSVLSLDRPKTKKQHNKNQNKRKQNLINNSYCCFEYDVWGQAKKKVERE